jgi:serine/threonine protein kinase
MSRKTVRKTKMLGAGSFGEVWQGEWDGEPVAIKVSKGTSKMAVDALLREADVVVSLKGHPNVRVLFAQETAGELQLVLEHCEDGSLLDWFQPSTRWRSLCSLHCPCCRYCVLAELGPLARVVAAS